MTDYSGPYSEHLAKFDGRKCTKSQITQSLLWHIGENYRYIYSHSAVKIQHPMLGGVEGFDYIRDRCVGGTSIRENM